MSVEEAVLSRIEREKKGEYDRCEAVAESSRQKWTVLNRNQQPQGPAKREIISKVADDSKRKRQRFKGGGRGGNAIIKAVVVSSVRI